MKRNIENKDLDHSTLYEYGYGYEYGCEYEYEYEDDYYDYDDNEEATSMVAIKTTVPAITTKTDITIPKIPDTATSAIVDETETQPMETTPSSNDAEPTEATVDRQTTQPEDTTSMTTDDNFVSDDAATFFVHQMVVVSTALAYYCMVA